MAVSYGCSFEGRGVALDALTAITGTANYQSTQFRTGGWSMLLNPGSGSSGFVQTVANDNGWQHFAVRVSTLPSVARRIYGGGSRISAVLNPSGTITVYDGNGSTVIGTSSTALATGTWYWLGFRASNGTSVPFLQINGTTEVTGTATLVSSTNNLFGVSGAEASAIAIYIDDIVVDDAGFLAPSKVDFALPISDGTRTAVTTGNGGTTNLWDAVNNTPPAGVLSANETATSNIEYPASLTEDYIANLETYTTLGVGGVSELIALQAVIRHGEDIATGTKNGTFNGIVSNPNAPNGLPSFTFGGDAGAHGVEPTLWTTLFGDIITNSGVLGGVTLGASPAVRVSRVSQARVGCIDFMGLLVVWTPAAGGTTQNGTLGLNATGAIANGGTIKAAGDLDVAGAGLVGLAGGEIQLGALAVTGTAALGQAGGLRIAGDLDVTGSGLISEAPGVRQSATLGVTGTGAYGQAGKLTGNMALGLTGSGSLGPAATATFAGALPVAGTGALVQPGGLLLGGDFDPVGTGSLGQATGVIRPSTLAATGTGALGQAGGEIQSSTLSIAGSGALALTPTATWGGDLDVLGSGFLNGTAAAGGGTQNGTLALTGTGAFSAASGVILTASATLTGTGLLGASGTLLLGSALSVTGAGAIGELGGISAAGSLAVAGAGTIGQAGRASYAAALSVAGSGALGLTQLLTLGGAASFTGTGALAEAPKMTYAAGLAVLGAGFLSGTANGIQPGTLALTGTGLIAESGGLSLSGTLAITGTGLIVESGRIVLAGALATTGTGTYGSAAFATRGGLFAPLGVGALGQAGSLSVAGSTAIDPGAYADVSVTAGPRADVTVGGFGGVSLSGRPSATVTVVKTTASVDRE